MNGNTKQILNAVIVLAAVLAFTVLALRDHSDPASVVLTAGIAYAAGNFTPSK